jgi:glycosyltransferase involved in cell wall biosynthesis
LDGGIVKIIFVSKECPPSPQSSGIGTYVWETGRALADHGHEVVIIAASDDGQMSSLTPFPKLTVIRLPDDEIDVGKRNIVARTLRAPVLQGVAYRTRVANCIADLVDHHRADIVEFPGFRGESFIWLAEKHRLPMVVRIHGLTAGINAVWKEHVSATGRCQLRWERREVLAASRVIVVSENQALPVRLRFPSGHIRVVHNSIDARWWHDLSERSPKEVNAADIVFVGSLVPNKGVFVLLRAAKLLRSRGWRGRLFLAGKAFPEFERPVRLRAAVGLKLPDWVVRLGICPRERLAGFYRNAGVCCLPSLVDAFPYSCLEAMACGGIVVGSAETGMAEMLTDKSGFVVPPGNVSSLGTALASALSLRAEERAQMKEAAQQRIRECFDHRIIIPKLLSVYSEAINSSKTRCAATAL